MLCRFRWFIIGGQIAEILLLGQKHISAFDLISVTCGRTFRLISISLHHPMNMYCANNVFNVRSVRLG